MSFDFLFFFGENFLDHTGIQWEKYWKQGGGGGRAKGKSLEEEGRQGGGRAQRSIRSFCSYSFVQLTLLSVSFNVDLYPDTLLPLMASVPSLLNPILGDEHEDSKLALLLLALSKADHGEKEQRVGLPKRESRFRSFLLSCWGCKMRREWVGKGGGGSDLRRES